MKIKDFPVYLFIKQFVTCLFDTKSKQVKFLMQIKILVKISDGQDKQHCTAQRNVHKLLFSKKLLRRSILLQSSPKTQSDDVCKYNMASCNLERQIIDFLEGFIEIIRQVLKFISTESKFTLIFQQTNKALKGNVLSWDKLY